MGATARSPFGVVRFMVVASVLGFFMSLGKAAVFKHIPVYYPDRVGAVGGVVGLVGGLGGFLMPIAFGALNDLTGLWQSCFWLLSGLVTTALIWMRLSSPVTVIATARNRAAATNTTAVLAKPLKATPRPALVPQHHPRIGGVGRQTEQERHQGSDH